MLRTSTKANRCQHCKVRMPDDKARHVLHDECIKPWLAIREAKRAMARDVMLLKAKRVEKAIDKKQRDENKTIPQLIALAQTAFNSFIRARDAGQPCICCGRPFELNKPGGSVDAGHWLSRGGSPQLRFDEANCHAQRKDCNRPGGAERFAFRSGVLARIGEAEVARLEGPHPIRKWTKPELREIKTKYAALTKQLKREAQ